MLEINLLIYTAKRIYYGLSCLFVIIGILIMVYQESRHVLEI